MRKSWLLRFFALETITKIGGEGYDKDKKGI